MRDLKMDELEAVSGGFGFDEEEKEDEELRQPTQIIRLRYATVSVYHGGYSIDYFGGNGYSQSHVFTGEYQPDDNLDDQIALASQLSPNDGIAVLGANVGAGNQFIDANVFVGRELNDDGDIWISVSAESGAQWSLPQLAELLKKVPNVNAEVNILNPETSGDVQGDFVGNFFGLQAGVAFGEGGITGPSVGAELGVSQLSANIQGTVHLNASDLANAVQATAQQVLDNFAEAVSAAANGTTLDNVLNAVPVSPYDNGDPTDGDSIVDTIKDIFDPVDRYTEIP